MFKKYLFLFVVVEFIFSIFTFLPKNVLAAELEWAKHSGGEGYDTSYSISTDSNNNIYTTTMVGGDFLVSKYDEYGNMAWFNMASGVNQNTGDSIVLDSDNNLYITGSFYGYGDFESPHNSIGMSSQGQSDIFITKYDTNGNLIWGKWAGGISYDEGYSISIDSYNNIYVAGSFSGSATFGYGEANETTLNSETSYGAAFIAKYDTDGNLIWVQKYEGETSNDYIYINSIELDSDNNIYISGCFKGNLIFGEETIISESENDSAYISKHDIEGNLIWIKEAITTSYAEGMSISIDSTNNIYLTGYFYDSVDFGSGLIPSRNENGDAFVVKYSTEGNLIWVKDIDGVNAKESSFITIDSDDYIYITGYFDFTVQPVYESDPVLKDTFIIKYDKDGNIVWVKFEGTGAYSEGTSITVDSNDNIYTIGKFSETVIFGDGENEISLTSRGYGDIYIFKLSEGGSSPVPPLISDHWSRLENSGQKNWTAISSSSNGERLIASNGGFSSLFGGESNDYGYLYTSIDEGNSWSEKTNSGIRKWYDVASSSDGLKLVAASAGDGNYIYTSIDGGETWVERQGSGSRYWVSVASSSDGNKLVASVYNGYIYTSIDGGETWVERQGSGSRTWTSVASSSDGNKLFASVIGGYLYSSLDGGETWRELSNAGIGAWVDIVSSADGLRLAATSSLDLNIMGEGYYIFTSIDGGDTWSTNNNSSGQGYWIRIASSSDGLTLITFENKRVLDRFLNDSVFGSVYISKNGGLTWEEQIDIGQRNWAGVASSSDGSKLFVLDNGGYIYKYEYSPDVSFPSLKTNSSSNITQTGAILNGEITDNDGEDISELGFQIGLDTLYTLATGTVEMEEATGTFSYDLSGLDCNTTYHYRAYATNSAGTSYGEDITFTTSACLVEDDDNDTKRHSRVIGSINPSTLLGKKSEDIVATNPEIKNPITTPSFSMIYTRLLKQGTRGDDIKQIQTYLTSKGYILGLPDGIFGPKTKQAVISFQKANGLTPDGLIGKLTIAKMNELK